MQKATEATKGRAGAEAVAQWLHDEGPWLQPCRCTIVLSLWWRLVQPADQARGSSARKCAYYCIL